MLIYIHGNFAEDHKLVNTPGRSQGEMRIRHSIFCFIQCKGYIISFAFQMRKVGAEYCVAGIRCGLSHLLYSGGRLARARIHAPNPALSPITNLLKNNSFDFWKLIIRILYEENAMQYRNLTSLEYSVECSLWAGLGDG